MLIRIVKHELRNLTADRTLWWLTAFLMVLIGYAVYNGNSWVVFLENNIATALQEEERRLTKNQEIVASGVKPIIEPQDRRSPFYVGVIWGRRYAYLPPAPLAPLSIGQSDLYPSYFLISTRSKEFQKRAYELENPENLLSNRVDMAFLTVFLFPLLILALSYDLISAEREQGTLAMVLSQPVSLRTFVAAKIAVRALVILLLVIGLSLAAFLLNGIDLFGGGVGGHVLLWAGIVVSYCAFWFSLAVAVNALGQSSTSNAIILASLWLFLVVLAPTAINLLVTSSYPVPSRVEFVVAAREAANEAYGQAGQVLSRYYAEHPYLLPEGQRPDPGDFSTFLWTQEAEIERSVQRVAERYDRQLLQQQAQVNRLRFLSPAVVTQEALNDIAGTGLMRYRHFLELVDKYHEEWRAFFVPKILQKKKLTVADYEKIPQFSYVELGEDKMVTNVREALAGLVVPTLLILAIGLWKIQRYPPYR